ncbi:hypothetical protein [uncultured Psychromonas sp.]|uniref:hypothetical protein n=1 Tax=uncultured Psychromonas sp. TaxID=173974 RepID=UPI00260D22E7|nr:hypothetical protein [uncultured Psychromonas sp.]
MRYCKLTIGLLFSFATNLSALELVTPSEESAIEQINQEYDINSLLISSNNKLGRYNKNEFEYRALGLEIEHSKNNYQKSLNVLSEKVVAKDNVQQFFKDLEALVLKIDTLEKDYENKGLELKEEHKSILNDGQKLKDTRIKRSTELAALKQKVVGRLTSELADPKSVKNVSLSGTAVCTKFQSINECLNENESQIIKTAKQSDDFLNERSVLLSYKIVDASQNLDGELSYRAAISFKPSYNSKIESILNEKFGLKSAVLTLKSNVKVDWYIDGNKVGSGKEITHEVSLGRHGILASYNSIGQSTIEVIESNGEFFYTFSEKTKKNQAHKAVSTQNKLAKTNYPNVSMTAPHSQTNKPVIKLKPSDSVNKKEKGYLYYIGLEPKDELQETF